MIGGICHTAPWGVRQPRSRPEDGPAERVLHVALSTPAQPQVGQESALRRFGPYRRIDWWMALENRGQQALETEILVAAWIHRPTLVWMQVQNPNVLSLEFLRALRGCCAPNVMLVLWTGDVVDYQAALDNSPVRIAEHVQPWMVDLSHGLDLFSASNTAYPQELVEAGGCSAGFMQCGYDWTQFARVPELDTESKPAWHGLAAMTAHRYPTMEQESRLDLASVVGTAIPTRLHVWGAGWMGDSLPPGIVAHEPVSFEATSWIYSQARVTISTSCTNRMRRYTSGRLQRILGSGGCCAVRSFPDMEGLGLVDGDNCLVWETPSDLVALLAKWLMPEMDDQREAIRQNALALARDSMTWNAAFEEMLWMVRAERARRGEIRRC